MNYDFATLLIAGLTLGFSAGISPGPMLALTISETLKYGVNTGIKVALAPLVTDTPIVAGSVFLLSELSNLENIFGVISTIGAVILFYLGYENIKVKPQVDSIEPGKINSLGKAILANFLNPNPYLFWITIGGPLLIGGFNVSIWNGVIFLFTFYLMLVGSKMVIAIVGGKMNSFFRSDKYLYVIRGTGILLFILAILLLYNGFDKIQL